VNGRPSAAPGRSAFELPGESKQESIRSLRADDLNSGRQCVLVALDR
jgi:hypothetical protein